MPNSTILSPLSRRSFLGGAAALGGAVALSGSIAPLAQGAEESQNEEFSYSVCRGNCMGACFVKNKVRDGKLVQTEMAEMALPEYNRICAKGIGWPQRTYSPSRVKYPVKRAEGSKRGEDQWERISWEEAIAQIADAWKAIRAEYGPEAIMYSTGTGSTNVTDVNKMYGQLFSLLGASSISNCYDNAGMAGLAKTVGMGAMFTGSSTHLTQKAKTILTLSHNPADSRLHDFRFTLDAKERGANVIVVDPVYNISASKATWYVPIRPATYTALLMAMTNICIQEGWIDEEYLLSSTVAPYLVMENGRFLREADLAGTVDETDESPILVWDQGTAASAHCDDATAPALSGSFTVGGFEVKTAYQKLVEAVAEWTPAKASQVCDIPEEDIWEMTRMFATEKPSQINIGYGIDHYAGGHTAYYATAALLAVTGNFGGEGNGIGGSMPISIAPMLNNPHLAVKDVPKGRNVPAPFLPEVLESGKFAGEDLVVKSMFFATHDYVLSSCDRQKIIRALENVDLVITADIEMSEMARYSDIVLPVAGWAERPAISGKVNPVLNICEQAIDPLFESKDDLEICKLLGDAMGVGESIPSSTEEYYAGFFDNDLAKMMGLSYELLKEKKSIPMYPDGVAIHGAGGKFGTPTTKLEFYQENTGHYSGFEGMDAGPDHAFDESKEHLPYFEPPHEAWNEGAEGFARNELASKYPLIFMSNRNRFRTHTQFFDVDWFKEVKPRPTVRLCPPDAAARGISTGDTVRVFNDRGQTVMIAEVHNGIRPGVAVYPKGWHSTEAGAIEGTASDLLSSYSHPAMYNQNFYDTLCEIEKIEGGAE